MMKPIAAALFILSISAPTYAQLTKLTIPFTEFPGGKNIKSLNFGVHVGAFAAQKIQFRESGLKGTVRVFKSVGVRRISALPLGSGGRTWSNVTLDVFNADMKKNSTVFTAQHLTTPTRVFSGSVSWPRTTGALQAPYAFPATTSWPFTSGFLYTGVPDIGLEFAFSGGVLSSGSWGTAFRPYHVDAPNPGAFQRSYGTVYLGGTCKDSKGLGLTSRTLPFMNNYHKDRGGRYKDSLQLDLQSHLTGPSTAIIQAIDFFGSIAGVRFAGITCDNLSLQGSGFLVLFPGVSNPQGFVQNNSAFVPHSALAPGYIGTKIWGQALWHDTGNGALLLTQPSAHTIEKPPVTFPARDALYRNNPTPANNKSGQRTTGVNYNPTMEWKY